MEFHATVALVFGSTSFLAGLILAVLGIANLVKSKGDPWTIGASFIELLFGGAVMTVGFIIAGSGLAELGMHMMGW